MTMTTTTKKDHHGVQKTCKCGREAWAHCPHSWYLRWSWKGQYWQVKIDDYNGGTHVVAERTARQLAAEVQERIKAGTYEKPKPKAPEIAAMAVDAGLTMADLGALFFKHAKNVRTSRSLSKGQRDKWAALMVTKVVRAGTTTPVAVGDILANSLTVADISRVRDAYAEERVVRIVDKRGRSYEREIGGTRAANRTLGLWRRVYAWAVPRGDVTVMPFIEKGVPTVKKFGEKGRERRFADDEQERLEAVIATSRVAELFQDAFDFALGTCCRKSEVWNVRWYQVRWSTNEIALEASQTKNGQARVVPMLKEIRAMLERRKLDPSGKPWGQLQYIFHDGTGGKRGELKRPWTRVRLRAAGFTGQIWEPGTGRLTAEAKAVSKELKESGRRVTWHDMRREGASSMVDDGLDPRAAQMLLDHESLQTTSKYLKLGRKALHGEMQRMEERRKLVPASTGEGSEQKTGEGTAESDPAKLKAS